jgi:uncharacterized membrane protein
MDEAAQVIREIIRVLNPPLVLLPYTWWLYAMVIGFGAAVLGINLVGIRSEDPRWRHLRYVRHPIRRVVFVTILNLALVYVFVLAGFWVLIWAAAQRSLMP